MTLDDYKVVLYRNQPSGWVAEVPAIEGCYALMPTREEALAELGRVFEMIVAEKRRDRPVCPLAPAEYHLDSISAGRGDRQVCLPFSEFAEKGLPLPSDTTEIIHA
jgi:predicted RNase H-like HicB family nuclease